jgi:hypothetical protein
VIPGHEIENSFRMMPNYEFGVPFDAIDYGLAFYLPLHFACPDLFPLAETMQWENHE